MTPLGKGKVPKAAVKAKLDEIITWINEMENRCPLTPTYAGKTMFPVGIDLGGVVTKEEMRALGYKGF